MATSPSLTTDAHLKPGEPRGTGGEPLEPQLGSDGRCSRQRIKVHDDWEKSQSFTIGDLRSTIGKNKPDFPLDLFLLF